ncbi:MAG: sulfite exporter TauE/SafE family protein [Syntrophales bacterium]
MEQWQLIGLLFFASIIMEFVDSSLGMMYGTVLSPLMILLGVDAKVVVPSILISQALGGFIASYRHQKFNNADFTKGTIDHKITTTLIWFGVLASVIGVYVSISISRKALSTYIACLVIGIAILIFCGVKFRLSKISIMLLGAVSAFNKALSGGGFGPLVAGGQLVLKDRNEKGAIGSTDFAEAPICLLSFILWVIMKGLPDLIIMLPLCVGAVVGGFWGPKALSMVSARNKLKYTLGFLILIEGIFVMYKVWFK